MELRGVRPTDRVAGTEQTASRQQDLRGLLPRWALRGARAGGAGVYEQLQCRARHAHDASRTAVTSTSWAMTEQERKNRGQKSAVIVERLERVQLRAMGCERFDLRIRRAPREMVLREGQDAVAVDATIQCLRHEN